MTCIALFDKNGWAISWGRWEHGDADPISKHYPLEPFVNAVVALMDALKTGQVAVAGGDIRLKNNRQRVLLRAALCCLPSTSEKYTKFLKSSI